MIYSIKRSDLKNIKLAAIETNGGHEIENEKDFNEIYHKLAYTFDLTTENDYYQVLSFVIDKGQD